MTVSHCGRCVNGVPFTLTRGMFRNRAFQVIKVGSKVIVDRELSVSVEFYWYIQGAIL